MKKDIDFDLYGHCVVCHEEMIVDQVIDGVTHKRFTAQHDETEFLLDDGSKMRVAICRDCKSELQDDDKSRNQIMKCVTRGWEEEVKRHDHWTKERKEQYLSEYSKRKILVKCEGLSKHVTRKHWKAHLKKAK